MRRSEFWRKPFNKQQEKKNMAANPRPPLPVSDKDKNEVQDLYRKLCTADAKLVGPDGEAHVLPPSLVM